VPQNITSVKRGVFIGGTCITSVTFHNNVTSIGENAFRNTHITSVNIPSSVTSIAAYAFLDCSNLADVYYSGTQSDWETLINKYIFNNHYSLYLSNQLVTSVTLSQTTSCSYMYVNSITSMDSGSVLEIGNSKFESCSNLSNIIIREGVTTIKDSAFYECNAITQVILPSTITSIGMRAFDRCYNMQEFVSLPTTPPTLSILSMPNSGKIYVPYSADHSVLAAYQSSWSNLASRIFELDENGNIPE